jgi:hypothetical protein
VLVMTDSPQGADYLLEGRVVDGRAQYAWVLPDAAEQVLRERAPDLAANGPMARPVRSDWISSGQAAGEAEHAAATLLDKAARLGRIRGWLTLLTPPDAASSSFPYHLALQDVGTKKLLTSGDLKAGSRYKVTLTASHADLESSHFIVKPRFVYVFAVDHFGKGSLLFPELGHGNEGNHLPVGSNTRNHTAPVNLESIVREGPHLLPVSPPEVTSDFEVTPPFGVDTMFLLTSEQPVDDPSVFEFDGARSKGAGRGPSAVSPLTHLLSGVGTGARDVGPDRAVPTDWGLERLSFRSIEK